MSTKIITSVIISLSMLTNSHGQAYYPNLINEGFNILSRGNSFDLTTTINLLYRQIRDYDRGTVEPFSLARLLRIYGEPEQLLKTCQNYEGLLIEGILLMERGREHCRLVRDFQKQIDEINTKIDKIDLNYKDLIRGWNKYREASADDFYRFVVTGCGNVTNTTSCFFHEVAGNGFKIIRGKQPFHPSRSIHQEVYLSYLKISLALLKAYTEEAARIRRDSFNPKTDTRIGKLQTLFVLQAANLARLTLSALKIAPRDIRTSDPLMHIEGETYIRLKWFTEQIIVNEANLNKDGSCWKTCDDYERTKFWKYGDVPAGGNDVCHGTIHQCYWQPLGNLCPPAAKSLRRHGGIKRVTINWENPQLVNQSLCRDRSRHTDDIYYVKSGLLDRCDVCTCICDDFNNRETVRTFSLRNVTSDIIHNMVITGMRFKQLGDVIYLQIQEARMLRLGAIDSASQQWVDLQTLMSNEDRSSGDDFYTMQYPSERSVYLNTLKADDEDVRRIILEKSPRFAKYPRALTGVRLARNHAMQLVLGARFTCVDLESGRLVMDTAWDAWVYPKFTAGTHEIKLEEPNVPTQSLEPNDEVRGDGRYVKFQPSDNRKDFGQTTVPFLDSQDVVADPPVLLSGAGLYYRGEWGFGGFIGLKLMSFNLSEFVATELTV